MGKGTIINAIAVDWWRATVRPAGRRSNNAESALITVEQAEHVLGFDQPTISRWAKKLAARDEYREAISRAARKKLQLESEDNHRAKGTGENEWWTPGPYIEAARRVLGAIDLDPATTAEANDCVRAAQIFTRKDDGLKHPYLLRPEITSET